MFARELAERWRDDGIAACSCDPGWIATKMGGSGGGALASGADTALWLLTEASAEETNGGFYAGRRQERANPQSDDAGARRRLWELAERQVGGRFSVG